MKETYEQSSYRNDANEARAALRRRLDDAGRGAAARVQRGGARERNAGCSTTVQATAAGRGGRARSAARSAVKAAPPTPATASSGSSDAQSVQSAAWVPGNPAASPPTWR